MKQDISEQTLINVAVNAPIKTQLTYKVPEDLKTQIVPGSRIKVPLGRRQSQGIVLSTTDKTETPMEKLKFMLSLEEEPAIGPKTLRWLTWLSQYYLHPIGQVFSMAFAPAGEKRKRKSKKVDPTDLNISPTTPMPPTPDQKNAIDEINQKVDQQVFESFLLLGVTGSGKTEVYLQTIEKVLALNKQALVLVPEISLTPQLIKRFVARFGEKVAVIHSHLTERERADQWWSTIRGKKQILVGARSALFCPLENLGLIIVDEEHDSSFKQDEQLKYHARDAAIMRARFSDCPIVLGSATPSLESWNNVLEKKSTILELSKRVENRPLPQVQVVDIKNSRAPKQFNLPSWMSLDLYDALRDTLEAKEQAALFLNRRGFAQFVMCESCGFVEQCPNCSVTYTAHSYGLELVCHYCGLSKKLPKECPSCKDDQAKPIGLGTEKVCEDLREVFPESRICRADRDQVNSRESLEKLLEDINSQKVDFIVGTQMIAKGHDFPSLTLVASVLADVGLNLPDFRSSERTFQLLTQVAGRAGRHTKPGRVIIQTYIPENYAIQRASHHDFKGFAQQELEMRKELTYPPYGRLAVVRIQGAHLDKVQHSADLALKRLMDIKNKDTTYQKDIELLGPTESAMAKIRNKHRYQILVKAPSARMLNIYLQHLTKYLEWLDTRVTLSVDMDPIHLL